MQTADTIKSPSHRHDRANSVEGGYFHTRLVNIDVSMIQVAFKALKDLIGLVPQLTTNAPDLVFMTR